ncbi:hypothetical protein FRZ03_00585 [Streptomyces misionensis]|uniref:Lipoprotein n=1 Tax=Streptomyces misionensis TaxID=67331 RepID=A0A5C6KA61_9ACTN|nr:hypothetical protein [Streptomyces misionensis]TWV58558.1 hypothetical protein FRZ03_00585 [Streptomyces misionensis]
MPYPSPPRIPPGPRRRTLLASAAGAALLTGCTAGADSGGTGPSATVRARARAAADSKALLARYDELLDVPGEPARLLASVAAAGAAHAYLLTTGGTK